MKQIYAIVVSSLHRWSVRLALVLITVTGFVRWQSTWMPTNSELPPTSPPATVGRDYFQAAGASIKGNVDVVSWQNPLPPGLTKKDLTDRNGPYYVYTLADKEALVRENLPATTAIEHAISTAYRSKSVRPIVTDLLTQRHLRRLLHLDGNVAAATGHSARAMTYYVDEILLGSYLTRCTDFAGQWLGRSYDADGERRITNSILDQLSATDAKSNARRLEEADAVKPPPYNVLVATTLDYQQVLLEYFKQKNWQYQLMNEDIRPAPQNLPPDDPLVRWYRYVRLHMTSPSYVYSRVTDYMVRATLASETAWPQFLSQTSAGYRDLPCEAQDGFAFRVFQFYVCTAMDRLIETQLALRAYKLDHGAYPTSLTLLEPTYLSKVPADPFAVAQLLRYQKKSDSYVLYSVGPDGIDNGGTPIVDQTRVPAEQYTVFFPTLTGDIVAGVNR